MASSLNIAIYFTLQISFKRHTTSQLFKNCSVTREYIFTPQVTAKTKTKEELEEPRGENAEERLSVSCSRCEESLLLQEAKWFEQLDKNIVLHLEDHLITDNVKILYPEM